MPAGTHDGYFTFHQETPGRVGRPKRDRSKSKTARRSRKANR